jgi:hypothetical protein
MSILPYKNTKTDGKKKQIKIEIENILIKLENRREGM